jgi:hypothetical protein
MAPSGYAHQKLWMVLLAYQDEDVSQFIDILEIDDDIFPSIDKHRDIFRRAFDTYINEE